MTQGPIVILVARASDLEYLGMTGLDDISVGRRCSGCDADVRVSKLIMATYGDQFPYVCSDCFDRDPEQVRQ
jgi:hypothetical protein